MPKGSEKLQCLSAIYPIVFTKWDKLEKDADGKAK